MIQSFDRRRVGLGVALLAFFVIAIFILSGCPRPGPGGVGWKTYTDPSPQHAFHLEIPAGWVAVGRTTQLSASDTRSAVIVFSPDHAVVLFIGDIGVPAYVTPNLGTQRANLPEGSPYIMRDGSTAVIATYRPGESFAASRGAFRVSQSCADPILQSSNPMGDATTAIGAAYARLGLQDEIHAGDAIFTCHFPGGAPGVGYVFAATELGGMGAVQGWDLKFLSGFTAPPNRAKQAMAILSHMSGSLRLDTRWLHQDAQQAATTSAVVADADAAVEKSISDRYDFRQASTSRAMENFSLAQRGLARFDDPLQGEVHLPNAEHQWRLPDGSTRATNTDQSPAFNAVELPRSREP